jgi:hypothetical protein
VRSPYHPEAAGDIIAEFFEAASEVSMWDKLSRAGLERIRSRCAPDHPTAISLLLPGTAKRTGMRVPMLLARCAFSWLLGGVCCRPVRVSEFAADSRAVCAPEGL